MDPRQPQNGASRSAHGFELDEATRASFQHADQTSAFRYHDGQAAPILDPRISDHQISTTDPVQGRAPVQNPDQTSRDRIHAPSITEPATGNNHHSSQVDPTEQREPAQSLHQPSTGPMTAPSMLVPGTGNDYQGPPMPAQGRALARSPRQTSTCPMGAPELFILGPSNGLESSEINATQMNYIHEPVMPARPSGSYQSQRIAPGLDVPRQQAYQAQDLPSLARSGCGISTAGTRAGPPVQQSFASCPEQGTHTQTQQYNRRDTPSPYLAGNAADNPLDLDAEDHEVGSHVHPAPHHRSSSVMTNPYVHRPDPAFRDYNAPSYSSTQRNTPRTNTPYLQQARGQVPSSSNGRLNLPSYNLPASARREHKGMGHENRRKRSRSLFEGDGNNTSVAGGLLHPPTSVGNSHLNDHNSEGAGSYRGDDVDDDEDAEEEEYGDLGVRQAPLKRRRLGNGGIAQDRPTYPVNDLGGPARPSDPIDVANDTYPATFPIDDGLCPPRRTFAANDWDGIGNLDDPVAGFDPISHSTFPVGDLGTFPDASTPAFTPTGASTGSRPTGRRARGNHGVLRRDRDGHVIFRAHGLQQWEPTRYHDDARAEMIAHMAQVGQYGEFSGGRQPERGTDPDDVTSFNPPQHKWYFSAGSGHVDWDESQDPYLYRYERRGLPNPDYEPGLLRFGGFIILNNRDHQPMTDWRHLPLTISSEISGGWMENIQRIDSRISVNDFQDRMPRTAVTNRSALTNRMGRFRINNGLASWNCRDGTLRIKERMLRHLTAEQIRDNTTKGYEGLTKEEIAEIEEENKKSGKYDKRAGKNAKRRR